MKISIALSPRKAAFAPLLYAGDMEHGIRRAAELGYDGLELNLQDPRRVDQTAVLELIRSLGLVLVSQGTGQAYIEEGLCLASADPAIHAAIIERLQTHVDLAARAGSQVVIGGVRGKLSSDEGARKREHDAAIGVLCAVEAYASDRGVQLTIEPINRYESNFINTVEQALQFISDAGTPRVTVLLDTFHANIEERSFEEAIHLAGDRLSHVHLVDSNRLAPGCGHIDFLPILRALHDVGYGGYLSAEILPRPDSETAARTYAANVRALLDLAHTG